MIIILLWIRRAAIKFCLTDVGRYFHKVFLLVYYDLEGKIISIIEKTGYKVDATFAKFYFYYNKKFSLTL